jgi:tetratricopeptide (TPR) repeat protein
MPSGPGERYDFFLSRRGSVAAIAQEVTDILKDNGYRVFTQDYDIPLTANFIEEMHEAVKNARDLVVLFTRDYEQSPYTRMEFTSFEANAAQSAEHRRMVILRCEDAPLLGLFAPHVYQDLVGIGDAEERRSRILAAAEGRSQALEPPPRPFIGVPPRIASFTGRAAELDHLDAILMRDKPAAVTQASVGRVAVQGMGGVGKTSLAIEYAHRFRGLYAGVCWCPAEARTGLLSALANLAVTLGVVTAEEADVEKAAKSALRRLAEQRATWLLIYDNVTAPDAIANLLPSAGARVLITSRFSDWSELADEVTLDVLPLDKAVAVLQSRTAREDTPGATALAEALGCLPLALDHAAAYCKRTQMRFGEYRAKASSFMDAVPRGVGYPRSVAATFDLAIAEATAQCPEAERLMALIAYCAPERIPLWLLEGVTEQELEGLKALTALSEMSLVKHDPFDDGTPAIAVHRLVQAVMRQRLVQLKNGRAPIKQLTRLLAAAFPQNIHRQPELAPRCAALLPHVMSIRGHALQDAKVPPRAMANLLDAVGAYLDLISFASRRIGSVTSTDLMTDLDWWRDRVKSGSEPIVSRLSALASQLFYAERYAEAEPLFLDALAIAQRTRDFRTVVASHRGLSQLMQATGRFKEAEGHLRDAMAFCKNDRFLEYIRAHLDAEMADLLLKAGRPSDALKFGESSLARMKPWDTSRTKTVTLTADALDALGRTEEAKALRERCGLAGPKE